AGQVVDECIDQEFLSHHVSVSLWAFQDHHARLTHDTHEESPRQYAGGHHLSGSVVEVTALDAGDERPPLARGEPQHRPVRMLRVPHRPAAIRQDSYLDAVIPPRRARACLTPDEILVTHNSFPFSCSSIR